MTRRKKADHELVERFRRGERDAQRELYERTWKRIYRVLLRLTRNVADAFDLTQETYIRAFTHIGQFDGRSSVATWLYRIAINEGLQFVRCREAGEAGLQRAASRSVEQNVEEILDLRIDVDEALAALSPDDQAILLLRYQDGLDYNAIAEITSYPKGTVASKLHRARARLRELLSAAYGAVEEARPADHQNGTGPSEAVEPSDKPPPDAARASPGSAGVMPASPDEGAATE